MIIVEMIKPHYFLRQKSHLLPYVTRRSGKNLCNSCFPSYTSGIAYIKTSRNCTFIIIKFNCPFTCMISTNIRHSARHIGTFSLSYSRCRCVHTYYMKELHIVLSLCLPICICQIYTPNCDGSLVIASKWND